MRPIAAMYLLEKMHFLFLSLQLLPMAGFSPAVSNRERPFPSALALAILGGKARAWGGPGEPVENRQGRPMGWSERVGCRELARSRALNRSWVDTADESQAAIALAYELDAVHFGMGQM